MDDRRLVTAIKAALSQILVSKGLSVNEAARVLRLTPAAVSMYISKKRGSFADQILSNESIRRILDSYANTLIMRHREGLVSDLGPEIEDLKRQIKMVMSVGEVMDEDEVRRVIRERITLEHETAERAMALAYITRNPLVRSILMQIATDSLRHAHILTIIAENYGEAEIDLDVDQLKQLADEEKDMHSALNSIVGSENPLVNILLQSIMRDELKHYELVVSLLGLKKR